MALTDMKQSKRQAKEAMEVSADEGPRYPYGLNLDLNDDSLKKLGIKKLPQVGEEMIVVARGVVQSAHENRHQNGTNRSVTIQLQKLDVGPAKEGSAVDAVTDAIKDS